MRDNRRDDLCYNPDKAHLWRLPPITESEKPPEIGNPSKRGIVIIPIFVTISDVVDVGDYYGNAACWARRSWLANSDAQDYGIDVIIYAENLLYDQLHPVLKANQLADENILYFDGSYMEGTFRDADGRWRTHGAKKGCHWGDTRFQDYEWVFQSDSDLFVMPGAERFNFFDRFFEKTPDGSIGVMELGQKLDSPPYPTPIEYRWCYDTYGKLTDEAVTDWKDRVEPLLPDEVISTIWSRDVWHPPVQGCLTAFPAREYMQKRSDCRHMQDIIKQSTNDEVTLSLWNCLGNPMHQIMDESISVATLSNRSDGDEFSNCLRWSKEKPHFLHYGSISVEKVWREGIGVL